MVGVSQTFVIVGCGAAKRDGGHGQRYPARDLYTSTYFQKKREYAETVGDQWMILSAEHGLLSPFQEISPYETSIDDLDDDALRELSFAIGIELIEWITWEEANGGAVEKVVVLAGKRYIQPLRERETFSAGINPRVVYPLQQNGLGGIGEQMSWLDEKIEEARQEQSSLAGWSA